MRVGYSLQAVKVAAVRTAAGAVAQRELRLDRPSRRQLAGHRQRSCREPHDAIGLLRVDRARLAGLAAKADRNGAAWTEVELVLDEEAADAGALLVRHVVPSHARTLCVQASQI